MRNSRTSPWTLAMQYRVVPICQAQLAVEALKAF